MTTKPPTTKPPTTKPPTTKPLAEWEKQLLTHLELLPEWVEKDAVISLVKDYFRIKYFMEHEEQLAAICPSLTAASKERIRLLKEILNSNCG